MPRLPRYFIPGVPFALAVGLSAFRRPPRRVRRLRLAGDGGRRRGGAAVAVGVCLVVAGRRVGQLRGELARQKTEADARTADAEQKAVLLDAVLAQMPAGVMIVRAERVLHRNDRYRQMHGATAAAVLADDPAVRLSSTLTHRIPFDQLPLVRALRGGEAVEAWSGRLHPDGGPAVDVMVSATPLRGPGGELLGAVSVTADVTAQKDAGPAAASIAARRVANIMKRSPAWRRPSPVQRLSPPKRRCWNSARRARSVHARNSGRNRSPARKTARRAPKATHRVRREMSRATSRSAIAAASASTMPMPPALKRWTRANCPLSCSARSRSASPNPRRNSDFSGIPRFC